MKTTTLTVSILLALSAPAFAADTPRQTQVERNSEHVMPFDMNRTTHTFAPTASGGVQTVVALENDPKQITLVRAHVRREATAFAHGDFTDPAAVHGGTMPGLHELRAGAKHISVRYADIPWGAKITYATADPTLVTALHTWFKAQVADHGAHASMKM